MAETPKKVVGNNCFLGGSPLIPSGRVPVFGQSSVCISGFIKKAVEIDVSLFSSSDRLYAVTVSGTRMRDETLRTSAGEAIDVAICLSTIGP